jgi:hypothetical protein
MRRCKQREFAALTSVRKPQQQICFQRLLLRFGIITEDVSTSRAFSLWTRVEADPEVVRLKKAVTRSKTKFVPRIYVATEAALASMTAAQLTALKHRVQNWPNL